MKEEIKEVQAAAEVVEVKVEEPAKVEEVAAVEP